MNKAFDYEIDFYNWALHNAQLLRERRLSKIDVEHIALAGVKSFWTKVAKSFLNKLMRTCGVYRVVCINNRLILNVVFILNIIVYLPYPSYTSYTGSPNYC